MTDRERVSGARLTIDREYTITDGNARCEVLFRTSFDEIRGTDLQTLHEEGILDRETLDIWTAAVDTILDGIRDEISASVTLTPSDESEDYRYDLQVTALSEESSRVQCSLQSVGTSRHTDETITALHSATRDLLAAADTEGVLHRTAVAANEVLGFPGTGVRKYDPKTGLLHHVSFGARVTDIESRPSFHVDSSPHGQALQRGETVIDQIEADDPYDREVFTETMYVPIGETGLLSVGTVGSTFDETDIQFAEILTENAAAAIKQVDTAATLREERERLELLRQILTRALRHNIRNDMNVISVNAQLLGEQVNQPAANYVETILRRAESITSLSEKAGAFEHILAASHTKRRIDLTTLLIRTASRTAERYPEADIETDVSGECLVFAHESLDAALANLLENACEHADSPTVTVSMKTDTDTVTVIVADDGPGIPDEEIAVLEAGAETQLEHGSGLGLWIVSWVVEQSGGNIEFDTTDGTRVEITLSRATNKTE